MRRNGNAVATIAAVAVTAPVIAGILARFAPSAEPNLVPDAGPATPDDPTLDEFLEERSGIRQYDGGLSREDAELLAAADVRPI